MVQVQPINFEPPNVTKFSTMTVCTRQYTESNNAIVRIVSSHTRLVLEMIVRAHTFHIGDNLDTSNISGLFLIEH